MRRTNIVRYNGYFWHEAIVLYVFILYAGPVAQSAPKNFFVTLEANKKHFWVLPR